MISSLRILYLENDPKDAELVQATREAEGIASQITRVVKSTGRTRRFGYADSILQSNLHWNEYSNEFTGRPVA
jgi:hypothetical protein